MKSGPGNRLLRTWGREANILGLGLSLALLAQEGAGVTLRPRVRSGLAVSPPRKFSVIQTVSDLKQPSEPQSTAFFPFPETYEGILQSYLDGLVVDLDALLGLDGEETERVDAETTAEIMREAFNYAEEIREEFNQCNGWRTEATSSFPATVTGNEHARASAEPTDNVHINDESQSKETVIGDGSFASVSNTVAEQSGDPRRSNALFSDSSVAVTDGIEVIATSWYNEELSKPERGVYSFMYKMSITNNSEKSVRLVTRQWGLDLVGALSKDGEAGKSVTSDNRANDEDVKEVEVENQMRALMSSDEEEDTHLDQGRQIHLDLPEGLGVVGEMPIIQPGGTFEYTSFAPLKVHPHSHGVAGRMQGVYHLEVLSEDDLAKDTIPTMPGTDITEAVVAPFHFVLPQQVVKTARARAGHVNPDTERKAIKATASGLLSADDSRSDVLDPEDTKSKMLDLEEENARLRHAAELHVREMEALRNQSQGLSRNDSYASGKSRPLHPWGRDARRADLDRSELLEPLNEADPPSFFDRAREEYEAITSADGPSFFDKA